jgi:osmotically-inducible protein OsmY
MATDVRPQAVEGIDGQSIDEEPLTAAKNPRAASTHEAMTDQALKLRLNDALIFDPLLPPGEISLAVEDGHVKLTGSVGTFFDAVEAAIVVNRFPGVSSVDNQLEVRQADIALCLGRRVLIYLGLTAFARAVKWGVMLG